MFSPQHMVATNIVRRGKVEQGTGLARGRLTFLLGRQGEIRTWHDAEGAEGGHRETDCYDDGPFSELPSAGLVL